VQNCCILCYAFLGSLPPKIFSPSFLLFTLPNFFQEAFASVHLSMEWTPLSAPDSQARREPERGAGKRSRGAPKRFHGAPLEKFF